MLILPTSRRAFSCRCGPDGRLSYRSVMNPSRVRASASRRPLQLVPESRGEHQSRSVGPLPATKTIPGCGPAPAGLVRVPFTGISSTSQAISSDVTVMTLFLA